MSVLKSGPATIVPGTNVVYTITVTNNGPWLDVLASPWPIRRRQA